MGRNGKGASKMPPNDRLTNRGGVVDEEVLTAQFPCYLVKSRERETLRRLFVAVKAYKKRSVIISSLLKEW